MKKLGLCSWTLGFEDLTKIMDKTAALGLDGLQFHGDHRSHDPSALRLAAEQAGLTLFAIDPSRSAPGATDQANGRAGVAYFRKVIDFAAQAGCSVVTVHGLGYWCADSSDRASAFEELVLGLQDLCAHASVLNIRLLWEMCNRYEAPMVRSSAEGRELYRRVARANFGLILDSFHMNIEDADPVGEITKSAGQVEIYHVSDSNRAGIGCGSIDFSAHHGALRSTGFDGPVMFELMLPELCPHTPPDDEVLWQRLDEEYHRSIAAWRNLSSPGLQ